MILHLLLAFAQAGSPPPEFPPAVLAYHTCVLDKADEVEAGTRQAEVVLAPEAVFDAAEKACQPLYGAAIDAFYATTMKTEAVQAYIRGKDPAAVRAEVEDGLRTSLLDKVVQKITLRRGGASGEMHARY
jgi:hypothetical protein